MITNKELDRRLQLVESRVKEIMKTLELSPAVYPLRFKQFSDLDKNILKVLFNAGREGLSTTEIARNLGLESPEGSGRVTVWNRLKRMERASKRLKGFPFVVSERKKWSMNFDDYEFILDTGK